MAWADNAVDGTALTGSTDSTHKFIPEIWRDEVISARENNLVWAKLFRRINHMGKKGDIIHLPTISNVTATAKGESAQVTLVAASESDTQIALDQHYEVSHLYEDFAMVQEAYGVRQEYTKKAGYALGKQIDTGLNALFVGISNSSPDHWIEGDGTDADKSGPAAVSMAAAGVIVANKLLDIADVPGNRGDRFLIINPETKADMLSIDDFTLYDYTGIAPTVLSTGQWGQIYGIDVYMTNCMPDDDVNNIEFCVMGHKDAACTAIQMDVRVQAQYLQDYLATLVTSDVIYGHKLLRTDHAVVITTGPDNS